ncbi:MAG: hypothetical protein V5B36_13735 [Candidatus Accumulibacter sp. UW25]
MHAYPYRETSLIIDVFSRDHGRVACSRAARVGRDRCCAGSCSPSSRSKSAGRAAARCRR